ncbi:Hypothetical protein (Fragment) [Durusdinium trenchii]
MGKSYGGAVAAAFASKHPQLVQKLVLACPAQAKPMVAQELTMPVLLLWAKDDWITWFSGAKVYQENCPQLTFHSADSGGHRILQAAWSPVQDTIHSFCETLS